MSYDLFRLEEVEEKDVEELLKLEEMQMSSQPHPSILLERKNLKPSDILVEKTAGIRAIVRAAQKFKGKVGVYKIVDYEVAIRTGDGNGKIVAVGVWGWDLETVSYIVEERRSFYENLPGQNVAFHQDFWKKVREMESNCRPKVPYFELMELFIVPSHYGLGLDGRLLAIGAERADKEGKLCFLTCLPMFIPEKTRGFKGVGRFSISLDEWGGEGTHVYDAMIRQPKQ